MMEPILWHNHDASFKSRGSVTAVCLAGETRTLMAPKNRQSLQSHLLRPLHADLYLALSPSWNARYGHVDTNEGLSDDSDVNELFVLTHAKLRTIVDELRPVTTMAANDSATLHLLRRLNHGREEQLRDVYACAHAQPLPTHVAIDNRAQGGDGYEWRRTNYQFGPCTTQLSLALRYRACLSMIELAERERGSGYTWVVRSRPDVGMPCALTFHAFSPQAVLYQVCARRTPSNLRLMR